MLLRSIALVATFASIALAGPCTLFNKPLPHSPAKVLTLSSSNQGDNVAQYTNVEKTKPGCSNKASSWVCRADVSIKYQLGSPVIQRSTSWTFANADTQMIASIHYKTGKIDNYLLAPSGAGAAMHAGQCEDTLSSGSAEGILKIEVHNYALHKM